MKKLFITMVFTVMGSAAAVAQACEIPLWPDGPAEGNGITEPETRNENWDVFNVSEASLYVWPADEGRNTGRAILICPGGGYAMQAAGHEGRMFAEWFAANGITAAVLKYRLPNGHPEIPISDAREAMKVLRERGAEWGIDPGKIGVTGFSAGGHLASALLTHYDTGSRPDFGILFYPVVSFTRFVDGGTCRNLLGESPANELRKRYSSEQQVTPDTPPTMIFFSDDDRSVDPRNGTEFYDALKRNGVESAIYIFPTGGHGWGFRDSFACHEEMKRLALDWIDKF